MSLYRARPPLPLNNLTAPPPPTCRNLLPPANEVWGKVIFSEVCVKNSVHGGKGVSNNALQVVSQHALQQVSGGGIPACLSGFQAHTQGGSLGGSGWGSPGPHPGGKLRGIWSRPTPKGEVEGDLARGVSALGGACSTGCLLWEGLSAPGWGVSAPGGLWRPPHDGYCCGQYISYWNAFLFIMYFAVSESSHLVFNWKAFYLRTTKMLRWRLYFCTYKCDQARNKCQHCLEFRVQFRVEPCMFFWQHFPRTPE